MREKIEHLIADSGAFIRGSPLHELAENVYTLHEVIDEIRDAATRQRLECLPFTLKYREPSAEDVKLIADFAKKTGDYQFLSLVDIKLMALAVRLEQEFVGVEHLRAEPLAGKVIDSGAVKVLSSVSRKANDAGTEVRDQLTERDGAEIMNDGHENFTAEHADVVKIEHSGEDIDDEQDDENDDDGEKEEEEEDGGGWITPANVRSVKNRLSGLQVEDGQREDRPVVACVTGDFSMQNVLMQIGLKVISPDNGLIIKYARQYVLRCYACFKLVNDCTRKFCPKCGNLGTLKRVSVFVNAAGQREIFINFKKPINIRGKRYSLPMPKGGKHAKNPILFEDQPIPQQRASKFAIIEKGRVKVENIIADPDYVCRNSPFAVNDVYSRASRFKASSHLPDSKRNPNEVRKTTGNRKRNNNRNNF